MGCWGPGFFENDGAGDFALAVSAGGLPLIEDAFDHVLEAGMEYLEVSASEEAIAAAAVVARLKYGTPLTDEADIEAWISREQPCASDALVAKARKALSRVMAEPSEILELWQEGGEDDASIAFKAGITALVQRLA